MPSILGVWRLRSITHRGRKVGTSQTHLVVQKDVLWELDSVDADIAG